MDVSALTEKDWEVIKRVLNHYDSVMTNPYIKDEEQKEDVLEVRKVLDKL